VRALKEPETLETSELKDIAVQRTMLYAKPHRVTVTQADLNYVGSVTIDRALLEAGRLMPGERVDVVDVTNGVRLTPYVIEVGPVSVPDGVGLEASGAPRVHS
jgi:hypothetical protein